MGFGEAASPQKTFFSAGTGGFSARTGGKGAFGGTLFPPNLPNAKALTRKGVCNMTGGTLSQKIKANWTTFWAELRLFPEIVPWMPGLLAPLSWRRPHRLKRIVAAITDDIKTFMKGIIRGLYWLGGEEPPPVATEPHQAKADELHEQVVRTYSNLRYGLAVISFVLPLFLWFAGVSWYGVPQQNSMSAYYFAEPDSNSVGPIRSWISSLHIIPSQLFALGGFRPQDTLAKLVRWLAFRVGYLSLPL